MQKLQNSSMAQRWARSALLASFVGGLLGCGEDVREPKVEKANPPLNDPEVSSNLEALGISPDRATIEGNIVRIDDDGIIYRDRLLAGDYGVNAGAPTDQNQALGIGNNQDKGYSIMAGIVAGALVPSPANVTNIKLVFDAAVPTNVRNAFITAAGDFNSTTGSTARFSQNNTGPTLTIKWMTGLWPTATTCSASSVACTTFPVGGMPGTHIYLKSYDIDEDCGWTPSALAYTARHELMHALGMMHPKDGFGNHITMTSSCSGTTTTCPGNPGYSTIMRAGLDFDLFCDVVPTLLQTDDKASLNQLY